MHRLSSLPGSDPQENLCLVEQDPAPVLFLTTASSDITTLASFLESKPSSTWIDRIRALPLSAINHPAQIDHYLWSTAAKAEIIIVRLLGSRGHWSYGLEQLEVWQQNKQNRKLIILSGTKEMDNELCPISSINTTISIRVSELLRDGGLENMETFLDVLDKLQKNEEVVDSRIIIKSLDDPLKWDWQEENGEKIGIIYYRSLFQSADLDLPEELNRQLRDIGLCPRVIFISSLKDLNIQKKILYQLKEESVVSVLTTTSFTTKSTELEEDSILWKSLDVPVIQILISTRSKKEWESSSVGLCSLDLTLQIVLPEIDGRITTRPCAFRELKISDKSIGTAVQKLTPNISGIKWLVNHTKCWIELKNKVLKKIICITLANYPVKNGRIANGVGLDTPESTAELIRLLRNQGYNVGKFRNELTGQDIMETILRSRTNDPETNNNPPLDYLSLSEYNKWWDKLPLKAKEPIIEKWGHPFKAKDLEDNKFAIHGVRFGDICILIQPSRGYENDELVDLHSPLLYPPHRYLAQYVWVKSILNADIMIHMGKHGSAEWLPGKAVGLSQNCAPELALGSIPNIYPFIVNDPGEGSQAKRRTQAVIIDHLTPPLGRAGLYGKLEIIENLLDEYYEARLLSSERMPIIKTKLINHIKSNELKNVLQLSESEESEGYIDDLFESVDSYLCELKESQIRIGLHILGKSPKPEHLLELLLGLARPPTTNKRGLTQLISAIMGFHINPWNEYENELIDKYDFDLIYKITGSDHYRKNGDLIEWLENQALLLLKLILKDHKPFNEIKLEGRLHKKIKNWVENNPDEKEIDFIRKVLWPKLYACADSEQDSILKALNGGRVPSGPSGAPTRGRPEVLPTGRNFFSVDLRGLPTETAWDVGKRSAQKILDLYLQDNGDHLRSLALSVWGTATMRNGGEDVGQLFALIGVTPVWDGPTRRMIDIEIIPLTILNRPRVDVHLRISGFFRDAFPQLIFWVNKAQRMVGELKEPKEMNSLAAKVREKGTQPRVYGSAPGCYGAGLQEIIESGLWESRQDIARAYISWSKWKYDGENEPEHDESGLMQSLSDIEVVLHNQDNREHDILDSDDYYQFHGGLGAAVEYSSGKKPTLLLSDNSRIERPRVHKLEKEIDKVMRSRVLNPRWIEGMKEHSYKGAFEMGATVDYLFAYDAATDCVQDWCYKAIVDNWLKTQSNISFLVDNNPWVLRDITERLLEASNRGLWRSAEDSDIETLKTILLQAETVIENK